LQPPDYSGIIGEFNGNGNGHYAFPEIPDDALEGRLGDICREYLGDLPRSYAWPTLLAVASAMIEERTTRTNLYVALVGPVHSGKSVAIDRAVKILGICEPVLMDIMSGSAEQLVRKTKNAAGACRLFSPDELGHLFDKMHIENSSYSYILNRAYYKDRFEILMGKKEAAWFDCSLSIVGGVVQNKFEKLFNASSTGGLYDRFLFGYQPDDATHDYQPFERNSLTLRPTRVVIAHDVWQMKKNWLQAHKDWNPRVVEHALRASVICASFDGRTILNAEDLGPAYSMIRYQTMIRDFLKPNPGENFEGRLAHKFLNHLRRLQGASITRRELLQYTHAYDLGPTQCDRVLSTMQANGDISITKVGKAVTIRMTGPEKEEEL
jgi:hypothetical protein